MIRLPDSLGLRYLDLLIGNPGRELAALDMVQLANASMPAGHDRTAEADELHLVGAAAGDEVLDATARAAYRRRLADLGEELAEAEQWHDTERASRARAEQDFLVYELAAAAVWAHSPNARGSTSPGPSGPPSPGSAATLRPPPPTSTKGSAPARTVHTPSRARPP
jgi:hypothetical protein